VPLLFRWGINPLPASHLRPSHPGGERMRIRSRPTYNVNWIHDDSGERRSCSAKNCHVSGISLPILVNIYEVGNLPSMRGYFVSLSLSIYLYLSLSLSHSHANCAWTVFGVSRHVYLNAVNRVGRREPRFLATLREKSRTSN